MLSGGREMVNWEPMGEITPSSSEPLKLLVNKCTAELIFRILPWSKVKQDID